MSALPATASTAVAVSRRRGPGRRLRALRSFAIADVGPAITGIAVGCVVWWVVTRFAHASWLPTPTQVANQIGSLFSDPAFRSAYLSSLGEMLIGYGIACVIGLTIGFAMAGSPVVRSGLRYYVDLLLILPSAALAPMLVAVFGLTSGIIIAITAIFAVSSIATTTESAAREVDPGLIEAGLVYGVRGRLRLVAIISGPAVLPGIFSGLHLGATRAMKGMIVGQVVVGVIGIGAYEARFEQVFDATGVWAIAGILIGTAMVLTWIVKACDHALNYWAY